jgi:FtsP/CotA-like multicopper oxidase with cupredoxin domain
VDPNEPLPSDDEWVVVLDDWLDGVTGSPDDVLAELRKGMGGMDGMNGMDGVTPSGMPGMDHGSSAGHVLMGASSYLLGGDAGDVKYPHFLLNGRLPDAPETHIGKAGSRLRLRIVNAAGDTAFRLALGGHTMTVTHSDGFPVQPVDTDALLIGMGERYDVLVTLADGVSSTPSPTTPRRSSRSEPANASASTTSTPPRCGIRCTYTATRSPSVTNPGHAKTPRSCCPARPCR